MEKLHALSALGAVLMVTACRKSAPSSDDSVSTAKPTASDANDARASEAAPSDATLRVVAESTEALALVTTPDGRLFVLTNAPLVYEAHADGSLALVAPPAAWSNALPKDEPLVGYRLALAPPSWISSGKPTELDLWFNNVPPTAPASIHVSPNGITATNRHATGSVASFRGGTVSLDAEGKLVVIGTMATAIPASDPSRPYRDLTTTADAALVALPARRVTAPTSEIWDRSGAEPRSIAIPQVDGAPIDGCRALPAFDGRTYAHCTVYGGAALGTKHERVLRLASDKSSWEPVFEGAALDPTGHGNVDAEGALWNLGRDEDQPAIARCTVGGACVEIPHDRWEAGGEIASYGAVMGGGSRGGDGAYWLTILINHASAPFTPARLVSVVARSRHDAWAIARSDRTINGVRVPRFLLVHSGKEPDARIHLPSEGDARVLVVNTEPPRKWIGQCDEIFVRLPSARARRDAGASVLLDDESAKTWLAEISRALPKVTRTKSGQVPWRWELVTGRLHDEGVAGVIVFRAAEEGSRSEMERAVQSLITKLAKNPVDEPEACCTLPVLEHVFPAPL